MVSIREEVRAFFLWCWPWLFPSTARKAAKWLPKMVLRRSRLIWHRGAVDADGMTGDGAGIHVQIPEAFLLRPDANVPVTKPRKGEQVAVGQVFLPRTDFGAQETCRTIVESEVLRMGYYIYGWRHVPVDV